MTDDPHYGPETTKDGVHACADTSCMTRGVPDSDLHQIAYALNALAPAIEDTPIKTAVFRDDTGLYVLLTATFDDSGAMAVVGAIYTPTLLAALRSSGYTLSYDEHAGGVN